jgi:hypothetical protein
MHREEVLAAPLQSQDLGFDAGLVSGETRKNWNLQISENSRT